MESVKLSQLSKFLLSEPISAVYLSNGIRFLRDPPSTICSGICKIFGARRFIPLFSVDFSAVPLCFMQMHSSMLLRHMCLPVLVYNSVDGHSAVVASDDDFHCSRTRYEREPTGSLSLGVGGSPNQLVLHPSVRASKLACRNAPYRNGVNPRSVQKRRSSLRTRRGRNSSLLGINRANGSLVSDLMSRRRSGVPFSSVVSANKATGPIQSASPGNAKERSSAVVGPVQDFDSLCCSANILVVESDRCYREEGAKVMLNVSDSGEWVLVVRRDGLVRYTHKAQKVMRPSSANRVTHAIIWAGDSGWKLEFANRHDWSIFKDLYKECSDRNLPQSPTVKTIPVPGVWEVSDYNDGDTYVFRRPESYITMNDDEVSRALARRTANYDVDFEDEEWLKKFNEDFFGAKESYEHLTVDKFELMIDAFEKSYYCTPDEFSDGKAAAQLFLELGRREVIEAVYGYWMKKRKQKRSALLRVFQGQQPRRAPLIPKPALRKRRSFKRQANQFGRGKQPSALKAMAAEQDALEERNAKLKVEEAKSSAKISVELAIVKRRRAQFLMENADLATYRATMALRIAESARLAESGDACSTHLLD